MKNLISQKIFLAFLPYTLSIHPEASSLSPKCDRFIGRITPKRQSTHSTESTESTQYCNIAEKFSFKRKQNPKTKGNYPLRH